MKRWPITHLCLLMVSLILSGCTIENVQPDTEVPQTEPASPPMTIVPTDTPSMITSPTPESVPTFTSDPESPVLVGPAISYRGISFTFDPVLGDRVFVKTFDDTLGDLNFLFAPEGYCYEVGCVTVFPVERYLDTPWGGEIIPELRSAIDTQSYDYFPTVGAAILLRAQTQHIQFEDGAGIRAVVMRGQDGYFANNEAIMYHFCGLTNDGKYYIEVMAQIDAPNLLSNYNPDENTNEAAIPVPEPRGEGEQLIDTMRQYNQEAQAQLETLEGADFTPSLELLDGIVRSIKVHTASDG